MKKLLAALVTAAFAFTAVAPAIAAERDSGKKTERKDRKKMDKKQNKKESGQGGTISPGKYDPKGGKS